MKKQRIAFLGSGTRAYYLAMSIYRFNPRCEIVAFCDIAQGLAETLCTDYNAACGGGAKFYMSYEDMIKGSAFDILLTVCDPDVQVRYACDAMERGIHVMSEPPAAFCLKDCFDLVNAVEKTGCKYQLNEQTRYWSFIRKWREMAQRGEFGRIYYADGEYLHYEKYWDNFREKKTKLHIGTSDPGYFSNPDYEPTWRSVSFAHPIIYLPHTLSPLLSITGGRVTKVSCFRLERAYGSPGTLSSDIECAIMYLDNDVILNVRAGFSSPCGSKAGTGAHWYLIRGTSRTVEWARSTIDTPKQYDAGGDWRAMDWTTEDESAGELIKHSGHGGSDWYPLDYFLDAVENDTVPLMDVYKAAETAAPAISAVKSADMGGTLIEIPDFRR